MIYFQFGYKLNYVVEFGRCLGRLRKLVYWIWSIGRIGSWHAIAQTISEFILHANLWLWSIWNSGSLSNWRLDHVLSVSSLWLSVAVVSDWSRRSHIWRFGGIGIGFIHSCILLFPKLITNLFDPFVGWILWKVTEIICAYWLIVDIFSSLIDILN